MPRHIKRTASAAGALVIALLAGAIALTANTADPGAATTVDSTTSGPAAPTAPAAPRAACSVEPVPAVQRPPTCRPIVRPWATPEPAPQFHCIE